MSVDISWEVQGLAELDRKLAELGEELGVKALRKAGRAGMAPVRQQMIRTAPFDDDKDTRSHPLNGTRNQIAARTQHLKEKISMTAKKPGKSILGQTAMTIRVGPTKAHAKKAIAAEYGTTKKKKQKATPFMRSALFDNKEQVVKTFKNELLAEINRVTRNS